MIRKTALVMCAVVVCLALAAPVFAGDNDPGGTKMTKVKIKDKGDKKDPGGTGDASATDSSAGTIDAGTKDSSSGTVELGTGQSTINDNIETGTDQSTINDNIETGTDQSTINENIEVGTGKSTGTVEAGPVGGTQAGGTITASCLPLKVFSENAGDYSASTVPIQNAGIMLVLRGSLVPQMSYANMQTFNQAFKDAYPPSLGSVRSAIGDQKIMLWRKDRIGQEAIVKPLSAKCDPIARTPMTLNPFVQRTVQAQGFQCTILASQLGNTPPISAETLLWFSTAAIDCVKSLELPLGKLLPQKPLLLN